MFVLLHVHQIKWGGSEKDIQQTVLPPMCKLLPGPLKYWVPWHEAKQAVHMRSVRGLDQLSHSEVRSLIHTGILNTPCVYVCRFDHNE
jgi:hypothetical protein